MPAGVKHFQKMMLMKKEKMEKEACACVLFFGCNLGIDFALKFGPHSQILNEFFLPTYEKFPEHDIPSYACEHVYEHRQYGNFTGNKETH